MKDRIKEIRKKLGMSQQEFAKKLQIMATTISKYERGTVKPTTEFLTKLTQFGVNLNWLITGSGSMFESSQEESEEISRLRDEVSTLKKTIHILSSDTSLPYSSDASLERLRKLEEKIESLGKSERGLGKGTVG